MKLLTKEIEMELRKHPLGSHDGERYPKVHVKFFTPWTQWTWYATEAHFLPDGEVEFFGLVEGLETELGYFHLSELQSIQGPGGLKVERDMYFAERYLDTKNAKIISRSEMEFPPTQALNMDASGFDCEDPTICE
jgi:hypothetical protein